ncbi:MAG: hypothetical protein N2422_01970 [Rhodobacteraceae bacterium]|nr:hypothetical protein [Paracoccaceae bacterium]
MSGPFAPVLPLLRTTLGDPRAGARGLLALGLPVEARWLAAGTVVVLSLLMSQLLLLAAPADPSNPVETMMRSPLAAATTQGLLILGLAFGMSVVAGWFGGTARFADGLLLAAWLEFVLLVVQLGLVAVLLVLPALSLVAGILSVGLFFWYLTAFTAEANGFRSAGRTLAGVVAGLFAGAFLMVLILSVLGLVPELPEVPAGV